MGATELDAEISRLTAEIATRRAEAERLRAGLRAHRSALESASESAEATAEPVAPVGGDTEQLKQVVEAAIPADGRAVVLWTGQHVLKSLGSRDVIGFPPLLSGEAGARVQGGTAAIASLEAQRSTGATHLVLPPDRQGWLAETPGFMLHLTSRYRQVAMHEGWSIHSLDFNPAEQRPWTHHLAELLEQYRARYAGELAVLDWDTDLGLAERRPVGCTVFRPSEDGESLPYLADSVEVVALGEGATPRMLAEARRVASNAIIRLVEPRGPSGYFEVDWLREPERALPPTSVVIPTYNAAGILDTCLGALEETISAAMPVEVVVVDDASTDETGAVLERWSDRTDWLRATRNPENRGFLESCNAGAEAASGELLVLLNNDTIPLPGWLPPLMEALVDQPDVGAAGGKLVYPNGSLQEAGGVIFSDGGGANFGRGDRNPDRPLYSFPRDVHYCSGALLATRADLFNELGGFDTLFSPGYYEETDYCFRIRRQGARVVYEPESAIVHLEGATAGTDEATGMKRYQAINREKFRERWAGTLVECPPPPQQWDELTWHRLARAVPRVRRAG